MGEEMRRVIKRAHRRAKGDVDAAMSKVRTDARNKFLGRWGVIVLDDKQCAPSLSSPS